MFRQQTVTARDRCTGRPATRTHPVFPAESQPATATEPPGLAQRGAISLALLVFPCLRPPSCTPSTAELTAELTAVGRSLPRDRGKPDRCCSGTPRSSWTRAHSMQSRVSAWTCGDAVGPRTVSVLQVEVVSTTRKHRCMRTEGSLCRKRVSSGPTLS